MLLPNKKRRVEVRTETCLGLDPFWSVRPLSGTLSSEVSAWAISP